MASTLAASSTALSTATFFLLGLDMPTPLGRLPPMPGAAHTVTGQLGQACHVPMQRRGVVRCAWAAWRRGKPALKLAGVRRRSRKLRGESTNASLEYLTEYFLSIVHTRA